MVAGPRSAGVHLSMRYDGLWTLLGDMIVRPAVFAPDGEQEQVRRFLGEKSGLFVEVGANEPIAHSQTYHLEALGWRGVLIEPLAECAERLRAVRRASVFEVAAGPPEHDGKRLPLLVSGTLSTLMSSIIQQDIRPVAVRHVPVRTLDSILSEEGIEEIDFISVDVEGAQLDVLRGFSIQKYCPRLLLVEDDVHVLKAHLYVVRQGYKLVRRTGLNNWYVPETVAFPVSVFGRFQLVRKLYLGLWPRRLKRAFKTRRSRSAA